MTGRDVHSVRIPRNTVGPVRHGHPWVYADRVVRLPAGTVVQLEDDRGEVVGWGLACDGPIAVRVLGAAEPVPARPDGEIAARIRRADALRVRIVEADTDAYRVVGGAGDGLPGLIVDRYGDVAIVRLYAAAWEPWLDTIVAAVSACPWVTTIARRYGVMRVDGRHGLDTLHGPDPAPEIVVHEHGMRLLVRVHTGQKTGMFLDQREHRRMVRGLASGRQVVNLFAYHGGFSVAAALGGAAHVTTVDVAPEAIADARENFRLNGLDPDAHAFEVADVFTWMPRNRPDLVIVDPPSLAKGAKARHAAEVAYRRLHHRLGPTVPRDGLLATSSCTAQLDAPAWQRAVEAGLAGAWSWLHVSHAPPDHPVAAGHPEGAYLKFGVLRRR